MADLPPPPHPPPPDLDLDPDPHQDFELDPDPAPNPHQNNADPQCGSCVADPDPKDMYHFQFVTNLGLDRLNIGVKDATISVLRIDLTVPSLGTGSSAGTSAKLSF